MMKQERKALYILLTVLLLVIAFTVLLAMKLDKLPDTQSFGTDPNSFRKKISEEEAMKTAADLLSANDLVPAEKLLGSAIKQHPASINLWMMIGTMYFKQEKYEQAEQAFRHVLRRNPDNAAGFNNLSETLIKLKRLQEAESAILNALHLAPKQGEILLNAASLYAQLKNDKQALKYLKQAMDNGISPEEVAGHIELVGLLERPDFMNYYNRKRSEQKE